MYYPITCKVNVKANNILNEWKWFTFVTVNIIFNIHPKEMTYEALDTHMNVFVKKNMSTNIFSWKWKLKKNITTQANELHMSQLFNFSLRGAE